MDGDLDVLLSGFSSSNYSSRLYENQHLQCASDFELGDVTATCSNTTFCVPLRATTNMLGGVIGLDYTLNYDQSIMTPTGNVTLGPVVTTTELGAKVANNKPMGKMAANALANCAKAELSSLLPPLDLCIEH